MKRQAILDAAAQIFGQKGYHAASMQDIADAVNLQKASLYHHVSSKQEILLAILDEALNLLTERLQPVLLEPVPPEERLQLAIKVYLRTLAQHRDLASVLLLEHRSLEEEFRLRHTPMRDRFEAIWREIILIGVREGVFQCQDIRMTARALLGTLNWTITWYKPDGLLTIDEIAAQFAELFLNGLLAQSHKEN